MFIQVAILDVKKHKNSAFPKFCRMFLTMELWSNTQNIPNNYKSTENNSAWNI